jgi:hypothetical protein
MASWPWLSINVFAHYLFQPHIEQVGITTSDVFFFGVKFCNLVRKKRGPLQQLQRLYFEKKWLTCIHIWRSPLVDDSELTYLINLGKINTDNFRYLPYALHYSYLSIECRLHKVL